MSSLSMMGRNISQHKSTCSISNLRWPHRQAMTFSGRDPEFLCLLHASWMMGSKCRHRDIKDDIWNRWIRPSLCRSSVFSIEMAGCQFLVSVFPSSVSDRCEAVSALIAAFPLLGFLVQEIATVLLFMCVLLKCYLWQLVFSLRCLSFEEIVISFFAQVSFSDYVSFYVICVSLPRVLPLSVISRLPGCEVLLIYTHLETPSPLSTRWIDLFQILDALLLM